MLQIYNGVGVCTCFLHTVMSVILNKPINLTYDVSVIMNVWKLYGGDSQNGPFAAHGVFQEPRSFPRPEEHRVPAPGPQFQRLR